MRLGPDEWLLVRAGERGGPHCPRDGSGARGAASRARGRRPRPRRVFRVGPAGGRRDQQRVRARPGAARVPGGCATRTLLGKCRDHPGAMRRRADLRDRMRPLLRGLRARFPPRSGARVPCAGLRDPGARQIAFSAPVARRSCSRSRRKRHSAEAHAPSSPRSPDFARCTPCSRCSRSTYSAPSVSRDAVSAVLTLAVSSSDSSFKTVSRATCSARLASVMTYLRSGIAAAQPPFTMT